MSNKLKKPKQACPCGGQDGFQCSGQAYLKVDPLTNRIRYVEIGKDGAERELSLAQLYACQQSGRYVKLTPEEELLWEQRLYHATRAAGLIK